MGICEKDLTPWWEDPPLRPPFSFCGVYMANGKSYATILDSEGRVLMHDQRAVTFVAELTKVMNENAARLAKAWADDVELLQKESRKRRGK